MKLALIFGMLLLSMAAFAQSDPDTTRNVETYRAFGPEHPGIYKHPASITQLDNGDLYVSYYGGAGEYSQETAVYGSRKPSGQDLWTAPVVIADTPFHGDGNPVVWQAPDGLVWLFYNVQYGNTWSNARVAGKVSRDGAQTWSDSWMVAMEPGSMVRGQPIVLNNGDYLLPLYNETGHDTEFVGPDTMSYFLRYTPSTQTWKETSRIKSEGIGNLQAQVVQLSDTHLIAMMRRGGGYGRDEKGYIFRSESNDGGDTWSGAVETEFPNPNAAVDLIKLENGHLLLVFNDSMNNRSPLTVAISTDEGKTFPHRREIGGGDNDFAYPYAIQTKDGRIHILYTTNGRTTIMIAEFNEEAILRRED